MIWAGISAIGKTTLAFCSRKMNSHEYQDILAEHLLPNGPLITDGEWILMQDNAPCHRSISTRNWFEANEVKKIEWPPYSPDLNTIENLWGWLVRKVYANGRQFNSVFELKREIQSKWDEVPSDLLESLISSVPNRLIQVIRNSGGSIDY